MRLIDLNGKEREAESLTRITRAHVDKDGKFVDLIASGIALLVPWWAGTGKRDIFSVYCS